MFFDFKKNNIKRAIRFPINLLKACLVICLILLILFSVFWIIPKKERGSLELSSSQSLGVVIIIIESVVFLLIFFVFFENKLKISKPSFPINKFIDFSKNGENINCVDFLDFEAGSVIFKTINYCQNNKIEVSSTVLAAFLLELNFIEFIFQRLNLELSSLKELKKYLWVSISSLPRLEKKEIILSKEFEENFISAAKNALGNNKSLVQIDDLFLAVAESDIFLKKFWIKQGVKKDDIAGSISLLNVLKERKKAGLFSYKNLGRLKGIGKDWAFGFTPTLDKFSKNWSEFFRKKDLELYLAGREDEIEEIERILARDGKNNVVLVGEPGIGIKHIVLGFARKIRRAGVLSNLNYKRVVELDINLILAGLKDSVEIAARFDKILSEALASGNIIIVIDDIQGLLGGAGGGIGRVDISEVLIPYLKSPFFQLIGIATPTGYRKAVASNSSLEILFEKVEVKEPTEQETILILEDILISFESKEKISVSFSALRTIVEICSNFIFDIPFPEKAISLLKEVLIYAKSKTSRIVLPEDVNFIAARKTGLPFGKSSSEENAKLLNLEQLIHQRMVNQEEAISVISEAMRRSRAGISEKKKPIGTFLFLGPTGVGKTETAKALAEIYFNSEEKMMRLDMTEYQEADSIHRLIGYKEGGVEAEFANKIRQNPFSLVLLDEIEKANNNILNLFLQVLDEGRLTDDLGKRVSFLNSIIIATSNAGSEFIRQYLQEGKDPKELKSVLIDYLLRQGIFKPEFVNRFDAVVVFYPLSKENMKLIAEMMLKKLDKRLREKDLGLNITQELIDKISEIGFDPIFGGRALRRTMQEKIESQIAEKILRDEYTKGEMISIDPKTL